MNPRKLKELLASHAEGLLQSRPGPEAAYKLSSEDEAELNSLLNVAEQIKSTLRPVSPSRGFESTLKRQLMTTAHLRQAEGYSPPNPERDLLILMALVGFVLSLAGVLLALKLRSQGI